MTLDQLIEEKRILTSSIKAKEETLRQLKQAKIHTSKKNLDDLTELCENWLIVCQRAVEDILQRLPDPKPAISDFLRFHNIEPKLLEYDEAEDRFLTPECASWSRTKSKEKMEKVVLSSDVPLSKNLNNERRQITRTVDNVELLAQFTPGHIKLKGDFANDNNVPQLGEISALQNFRSLLYCLSAKENPRKNYLKIKHIFSEIESAGWERLSSLSSDLKNAQFEYKDGTYCHKLKVVFDDSDLQNIHISSYSYDLPIILSVEKPFNLRSLLEKFIDAIDQTNGLRAQLTELDEHGFVIKCEGDDRLSSCSRSIVITPTVSMRLTLDPENPRNLPDFQFNGPDDEVSQVASSLDAQLLKWNEEESVASNLQNIFELNSYDIRPTQVQKVSSNCCICYEFESAHDKLSPDQTCQNCNQIFHHNCIYKWLSKQPKRQLSLGFVFGPCPYCKKNIKVKIARF